jgi:uncharacterized membrane protein
MLQGQASTDTPVQRAVKPRAAQALCVGARYDAGMSQNLDPPPQQRANEPARSPISQPINRNISDMAELEEQELARMTTAQRRLERFSRTLGRPGYILALLGAVVLWIAANVFATPLGLHAFDPPPFQYLQGTLTFIAMLTATVVLVGQGRQTKLAEQRAHLDLQINLLTEQKVTKLIHLLEELREDLPNVSKREDPHASVLKEPTDAAGVASALERAGLTSEVQKAPGKKPK